MDRPKIPKTLERDVLCEAGHRCAIPTCQQTPVEIAHIDRYADVLEHTFDNLIALCANCHSRYDRGEIDRKAMMQYKANLSILNSRYGDLEKRILTYFADNPNEEEIRLSLSGNMDIQIMYLIRDEYLEFVRTVPGGFAVGVEDDKIFRLTDKGKEFIQKWLSHSELE
jgi:hypothetical protein